jgi:hypothetical protein
MNQIPMTHSPSKIIYQHSNAKRAAMCLPIAHSRKHPHSPQAAGHASRCHSRAAPVDGLLYTSCSPPHPPSKKVLSRFINLPSWPPRAGRPTAAASSPSAAGCGCCARRAATTTQPHHKTAGATSVRKRSENSGWAHNAIAWAGGTRVQLASTSKQGQCCTKQPHPPAPANDGTRNRQHTYWGARRASASAQASPRPD